MDRSTIPVPTLDFLGKAASSLREAGQSARILQRTDLLHFGWNRPSRGRGSNLACRQTLRRGVAPQARGKALRPHTRQDWMERTGHNAIWHELVGKVGYWLRQGWCGWSA